MMATDERPLVWIPCPSCWGARAIGHPCPGGYAFYPCPTCLGIGEVPSVPEDAE